MEKRGKAFLAEETAYAEIMRHRSLGNCRAPEETVYMGHLGAGGTQEDGPLSPAPLPTPSLNVAIVEQIWNQFL